eukprot:EG_transcript_26429
MMYTGEPFCGPAAAPSPPQKPKRAVRKERTMETDEHRLLQRAKQIAYGENTPGYSNLMRVLETNPSLLKGGVPVKPSLTQRCSKRSWDGQIRKWRRALHMYDVVDFGAGTDPAAADADAGRHTSVELTRNPLFWTKPPVAVPDSTEASNACTHDRVRYSAAHLLSLANSPLVALFIDLPEPLSFLDNRVDLEDETEDYLTPQDGSSDSIPEQWLHRFAGGWAAVASSPSHRHL